MDDNVELIRSNKGGMKLIHRGYMYTVHKKRQSGGIRWRCTQRSLHCKGSISTGSGPPKVNMPHNHIPDPHSVALARCRQFEEFADFAPLVETECDDSEVDTTPQKRVPDGSHRTPEILPIEGKIIPNLPASRTNEEEEEVCLRWNSHHSNMKNSFPALLQREQYVDVTLASEGKSLKCHKLILSSCSTYFDEMLSGIAPFQHPVVFLNGVPFWVLKSLIDFMYAGEVHIEQNKLQDLLKVAEMLQIKGLTGKTNHPEEERNDEKNEVNTEAKNSEQRSDEKRDEKNDTSPQQSPQKKENEQHKQSAKVSKPFPPAVISAVDPLALLRPAFFEDTPEPKLKVTASAKKYPPKKLKKRKLSEHEPSPPPVLFRKGTKSRPHVKVPRYYHNDYENLESAVHKSPKKEEPPVQEETYDIEKVKTEPMDIEDTDVGYVGSSKKDGENSEKVNVEQVTTSEIVPGVKEEEHSDDERDVSVAVKEK